MPMNMLFYGQPGVGKTSAARILLNKLEADCYEINGSLETGIDHVRKNIEIFCVSMSLHSDVKVCFIDECEYLSVNAQASLRGLIEKCGQVRFVLTANEIKKTQTGSEGLVVCRSASTWDRSRRHKLSLDWCHGIKGS